MITGVALSTHDLVKRYGRRTALDGFTLQIPRGVVVGLVGPNGAGKTTWMMTVMGFLRPNAGTIDILGKGPFHAALHSGRVAILPQDSELPLEATPSDLLVRYGCLQGLTSEEAKKSSAHILKAVNLADRAQSPVRTLSHGMRKRVMLAQCFIGSPELVLLDEPLNGLDPAEQVRMRNFIHARRGRQTIVISSHNLTDIEALCSHVALVNKGKVEHFASVKSLTEDVGRIVYELTNVTCERAVLETELALAFAGASFAWQETSHGRTTLTCTTEASVDPASVNHALLPCLLAHADILTISTGVSLEQAVIKSEP